MTTYVLGAGASFHAGYPLCSELWPWMVTWVTETHPPDSEYRQAIDAVATLNGPVLDVEGVFSDLDLGRGAFRTLTEDQQNRLNGRLRRCLADYFKSICRQQREAPLYVAFANRVEKGDVVITFNYDVSLENELIRAHKFRVRNGYGSSLEANWDEPESDVTVLKPHGSINWIAALFGGSTRGPRQVSNSLGERPFVDNVEALFLDYPSGILDNTFRGGGVASSPTLILPTYEKKFSVATSLGDEWIPFYESLWSQAAQSLERSSRIVIVGYSMPDADHRSRGLLLLNPNKRAEVFVCCASSNEAVQAQFRHHGFGRVRDMGSFADLVRLWLPAESEADCAVPSDAISLIKSLVGEKGLLPVRDQTGFYEVSFTVVSVEPTKEPEQDINRAINASLFCVRFEPGTLIDGRDTGVFPGSAFSKLTGVARILRQH